jgi:hypothetical protein
VVNSKFTIVQLIAGFSYKKQQRCEIFVMQSLMAQKALIVNTILLCFEGAAYLCEKIKKKI